MLEFFPLADDSYYSRATLVTEPLSGISSFIGRTVESEAIFGKDKYEGAMDRHISRDHLRGYITLVKPCFNPIIAGGNASVLLKILGYKQTECKRLLEFNDCMNENGKPFAPTGNEPCLWFPEYLERRINSFNPTEELMYVVRRDFMSLTARLKGNVGNIVQVPPGTVSSENCYVLVQGIAWIPAEGTMQNTAIGLVQKYRERFACSEVSRTAYLLALARMPIDEARTRLGSCIMHHVMVVPVGMRPRVERHDPLSLAYNELIIANNNLRTSLVSNVGAKTVGSAYRALQKSLQNLLSEHDPIRHPTWQSIAERLSHKNGHVRSKMLGKRVDFSGRSVITIDPNLSLRNVAIPLDMAPKLYRSSIYRSLPKAPDTSLYRGPKGKSASLEALTQSVRWRDTGKVDTMLENTPVIIGRQPTLHKLSTRAFYPVLTGDRSIHINPLCVSGFNADFDGDQMWVRVPVSMAAKMEARELMTIEQNMYWPKNGECCVVPRQEIIYGLNVCTREGYVPQGQGAVFQSHRELCDALYYQTIAVDAPATLNGYTDCAGRVAFAWCFPGGINFFPNNVVPEITSKSIVPLIEELVHLNEDLAIDTIDKLVFLGFHVAGVYPPTFSLLDGNFDYTQQIHAFHEEIADTAERYGWGWEELESYERAYDSAFLELVEKPVKAALYNDIGLEDGFVRMAESGARGSKSNLLQLYGYKGRVQRNSGESFRAVIEHSYVQQLTPLEHFVTAYGGREGLITKSLNTADSGYAMRKMWHATSPFRITSDDCGTQDGIAITKSFIISYFSEAEAQDIFVDMVTGRYEAKTNQLITKARALQMASQNDYSVIIRSPLTCSNPCCKLCYGEDLSNHRPPAIGLPIGFIAAHSIGEPGTQLNMDSFKKGGVAGAKTKGISGFDKLEAYIECSPLRGKEGFSSYVPIAWATGETTVRPTADGQQVVMIEGSQKSVHIPSYETVRTTVTRGEGICERQGDFDINELVEHAGIRQAQTYLIEALYSVYKDEGRVNLKHLEVLVAAMTMHYVYATDRPDLIPGQYHDTLQMLAGDLSHTEYTTVLKGVKAVQQLRTHALSRVLMESVKSGLSDIVLLGLQDPLTYPLNRIMVGLPAWADTANMARPAWTTDAEGRTQFMKERKI